MKLLVAIDFSELADRIIGEAEKLAKTLSAKVFLLHVIPPSSPVIDLLPDVETLLPREHTPANERSLHLSDTPESAKMVTIATIDDGNDFALSGTDSAFNNRHESKHGRP